MATWDKFGEVVVGRTWNSRDLARKTVEKTTFKEVNGKLCTFGTKSKKNCYTMEGLTLRNEKYKWITGTLQPNGDVKWSHGFTTRAKNPPCQVCKVTLDDWVGKKARTWKTLEPSEHGEQNNFYKFGGKFCSKGTLSGVQCFTRMGEVLKHSSGKVYGWLEPDGLLRWSHGWTSQLLEDPCTLKDHVGEFKGKVDEFGIPTGN